jgi:hypothetical protein
MYNMYNNKILKEKFKEVNEFSDTLHRFVLVNNQININENLINVYNKYDTNLRILFKNLVKCGEEKKTSKDEQTCLSNFRNEFDSLRSDISKIIEKDLVDKK